MIIKKKQIVTVTLTLALGAAVFVNWYYTKPEVQSTLSTEEKTTENIPDENLGDAQYVSATTANNQPETLSDFKLKRDSARDEAKETLNQIIKDQKSSPDAVSQATASLQLMADEIKDEADLENLISAKVSCDCIVIIDTDVCQIILENSVLTENISLQIKELVVKQTKIPSKNITIIELKG